ncbi:alpha/beta hydrolase [Flavobacterium zepuense]|uniref:Alpha/beta hydrolase n=1 Tax=Flavobacterium zepuense TaxID=2593302 RepID=A0A552VAL4_9FLAO|nr:alpha/beta hydrolase [Flavobacterium zepuense]TRW27521.1 alpha/beta hydrolase [Flavobacterium zepuense]
MKLTNNKTILFITGAFVSHICWDSWVDYFEQRGYHAIAPPWPYKDDLPRVLRERQPYDVDLADLTLTDLVDHYANFAINLPEKPIIIGHSLGGLIAQILINRGLGSAGVGVHPIPPVGIIPYEFTFLKSTWKVLGLFSSLHNTLLMSFKDFQYSFVNEMPIHEQLIAYEKYAIPESKRVARGGLTAAAKVDFDKEHAPLLLLSGSLDNLIPPHLINRIYKRYKKNASVLEYVEMANRNHATLTQPGWENVARYISNWLNKVS